LYALVGGGVILIPPIYRQRRLSSMSRDRGELETKFFSTQRIFILG
jgi:hypothetical protein